MPMLVERIAYRAAQRLRVSWYFGQKWLSARLTDEVPAPPELKARMPDRARILADLRALLDEDWRNIARRAGRASNVPTLIPKKRRLRRPCPRSPNMSQP